MISGVVLLGFNRPSEAAYKRRICFSIKGEQGSVMKTNLAISILVLSLSTINMAHAFQEKFLVRAMGQKNFSSALMSSTMEVARDLKDQTGCLHNSEYKPSTEKFVICDFNEVRVKNSRCHLINITDNTVQASGPVAFGSKGVTASENENTAKKTLLGAFITTHELNEKSGTYTRELIRANGSALPKNASPQFQTKSKRLPASTKGNPVVSGEFADVLKNESSNLIWVNHSVKHPYDNACGNVASRKVYESDMNDVQLAEHRAKMKKEAPRGIANQKKKSDGKRGIASEKE